MHCSTRRDVLQPYRGDIMKYEIRRKDRALPGADALALLERGEYGVLSTVDGDGAPYATPLSYVMIDGSILFHCAQVGHKIDNLSRDARVCFCVVGAVQAVYEGGFTTNYQSALAFGTARKVTDAMEKRAALMALAKKYLPEHMAKAPGDIEGSLEATAVYRIEIESITGKARRAKP